MTFLAICGFAGSAAFLVYVLAGYPVWLHWMASRSQNPVHKDATLRSVSVVIAVRNGEKFLQDKLDSVLALNYPPELVEIIVVSDGSNDATDEIAASFVPRIQFLRLPRGGKGAAVNAGIAMARNEILVLTDVRQRLATDSVRNLVAVFGDPKVGVVSGELSILSGESAQEANTGLYWRYEVWMRKGMSRIDSTFGANGPFYAMRRALAVPIPEDTLLDDVYLPLATFFRGYRIILEPSAKAYDYPTSLHSEFRRKVRTQAGLYQILRQYPQLLTAENRMRLHFVSGKFCRLLLPFGLILMAVSSLGLPEPWRAAAVSAQMIFYAAALVDLLLPEGTLFKKVTAPIRTFVVLLWAALMGMRIFFVPPRDLWKETTVRKVEPSIASRHG